MKNFVYIGRKFYIESGTRMGSIYNLAENGHMYRSDWGKVTNLLENGQEIHIRPANKEEKLWAYEKLDEWKAKYDSKD